VRGSSGLGSVEELRVNMKTPNEARPGIRQAGLPPASAGVADCLTIGLTQMVSF